MTDKNILLPDVSLKNLATNNRYDKADSGLAYTYIVYTDMEGKERNARMLNTAPEKILLRKGLTAEQCRSFRDRSSQISNKAILKSGCRILELDWREKKKGKFLGKGFAGTVKFAEVYDDDKKRNRVIAAKKVSEHMMQHDFDQFKKEVDIQNKLGNTGLKVYGYSKTETKKDHGKYILFMELATGIEGKRFIGSIRNGDRRITAEDKAKIERNLRKAIDKMHSMGIYYLDWSDTNFYISPEHDFEVKIIDFGLARDFSSEDADQLAQYVAEGIEYETEEAAKDRDSKYFEELIAIIKKL